METLSDDLLAAAVRDAALPLDGAADDYRPLLDLVGDARIVLLGEASHGTHEFYRARAEITKQLIREKGFVAVAVEADWPDAARVNRYARGSAEAPDAVEALDGFERFPRWMWRNADVVDFVGWLRAFNERRPLMKRAGFYGLDLYSLHRSLGEVLRYLEGVNPEAFAEARERYACFERFDDDAHSYGRSAAQSAMDTCEQAVVEQLLALQARRPAGGDDADAHFEAEQNARLAKNAEHYYRTLYRGRISSWNLRDRHMVETLEAVREHLGGDAKVVVWAHNSHLGDARATEFSRMGELNVGQLVRERYGDAARLIGFTTYQGTVTAASDWDAPTERKRVRRALPHSYEALFHQVGVPRFFLALKDLGEAAAGLREPRLERAIGVIYRPETERHSHYFEARLTEQFDAVLHFDETRAVEPLERTSRWAVGEAPDTYPSAL